MLYIPLLAPRGLSTKALNTPVYNFHLYCYLYTNFLDRTMVIRAFITGRTLAFKTQNVDNASCMPYPFS